MTVYCIVIGFLVLYYYTALTGAETKRYHYLIAALLAIGEGLAASYAQTVWVEILLSVLLLWASGIWVYGLSCGKAVAGAILIVELLQLCFGIVDSLSGILSPMIYEAARGSVISGWFVMMGSIILALGIFVLACNVICRFFVHVGKNNNQYLFLLMMPMVMILLVSSYFLHFVYGNVITLDESGNFLGIHHGYMFFMELCCLAGLICIVYAHEKLEESYENRERLVLLEQAASYQEQYVSEAKIRYEQTKALRHDIKNHMIIIGELVKKGQMDQAHTYLNELEEKSQGLSFICQTNNVVLDILLENKLQLALAEHIGVHCLLKLPDSSIVSSVDLCIIFANALDNAVHACRKINKKDRYLSIRGQQQGDFFLIEIKNSCFSKTDFEEGIGLRNIKTVVEKYHGDLTKEYVKEYEKEYFLLSILLNISQQPKDISQPIC